MSDDAIRARAALAKKHETNRKWKADLQKAAQEAAKTPKPRQPLPRTPPPAKRAKAAKIRPISSRRAKQESRYGKLRRKYLEKNPVCHCCIERKRPVQNQAMQIHHTAGREGEMLNEVLFWMPICEECHTKIHANPKQAHKKGWMLCRHSGTAGKRIELQEKRGHWPHVVAELERG